MFYSAFSAITYHFLTKRAQSVKYDENPKLLPPPLHCQPTSFPKSKDLKTKSKDLGNFSEGFSSICFVNKFNV